MLKGDAIKLTEIRREDTFVQNVIEGTYCLQGYGVVSAYIGAGAIELLSQCSKLIGS